jgi:hypothetical protein
MMAFIQPNGAKSRPKIAHQKKVIPVTYRDHFGYKTVVPKAGFAR